MLKAVSRQLVFVRNPYARARVCITMAVRNMDNMLALILPVAVMWDHINIQEGPQRTTVSHSGAHKLAVGHSADVKPRQA